MQKEIDLEILKASHQEHFKASKEFSTILKIDNPRRKRIEKSMNELQEIISKKSKSK